MSLKRKESSQAGGLRVAADDPHLVSLGGGRLSTAVTIHHLPIGDMSIGSSNDCGVVLTGSGVQPHHCTVYRSESGAVYLVPESGSRVLIDGTKIVSDTILTQGAMITIGKSNYLRFNNPAEAQMIRSTIGSNERISMPQIDFNQDSSSSNEGTPDGMIKNDLLNYQNYIKPSPPKMHNNNETILNKLTTKSNDLANFNNFHSPKVFAADSITVNAPAKDVLGTKFNNFTKNLSNFFSKSDKVPLEMKHNQFQRNVPSANVYPNANPNENCVLTTKVNNYTANSPRLQPSSACYDRYPKPGSYGNLQVFPLNGINSEINPKDEHETVAEEQRRRAQFERMQEEEISKIEQDRLEEILKMCADFERQNSNIQSSPIVQNRIKTNGSLPREKKSPFGENDQNLFFPSPNSLEPGTVKTNSGYENVKLVQGRRVELSPGRRYENVPTNHLSPNLSANGKSLNRYENVSPPKKPGYVPQSPRTKIKTCVSPKKTDYDLLVQSFEEKLRMEIQALRENKTFEHHLNASRKNDKEPIYGSLEKKNRNINNLTLTINTAQNGNEEQLNELQRNRNTVLATVRNLKTEISELQRQEEEILRELDMEKALVTAELATEQATLLEMERNLSALQNKTYRMEAQRNANRVMQETQQAKLKQSIDVKQEQMIGLKSLLDRNPNDPNLLDDLNRTADSLENDQKSFEDLEFQYLEEETDWLGCREELHNELKILSTQIDEKHDHIVRLEHQGIANQHSACADTKDIERNLWSMLSNLEKNREELKAIDKKIYEISGQQYTQSDSDDEPEELNRRDDIMSQSLFGSVDLQIKKSTDFDLMSKSVNENMLFTTIEVPIKIEPTSTSTPNKSGQPINISEDITKLTEKGHDRLVEAESKDAFENMKNLEELTNSKESLDTLDPLLKLKYNLSPPFEHKIIVTNATTSTDDDDDDDETNVKVNLNLSIESDDFEVNPLEKRVPSQDDIDRICKITTDAPILTQGASDKVIESIKEIERNRQLLLAQQGSHVIEHERQKMNELKKKSHDEARAQYLQLQSISSDNSTDSYVSKDHSLEKLDEPKTLLNQVQQNGLPKKDRLSSPQRHSQPDFDRTRPLSETNSELGYEPTVSEKPFKSSIDIRLSTSSSNRLHENGDTSDNRTSIVSQSDAGSEHGRRVTSGHKRSLPKHQRPLTRYLPIMSSDLDLRQHIETAGHQVTLCPHVFLDSYSCRGYLHKLGATFHGWSRRWFVLDRQKMALIYYSDKSERKPRGGAYFSTIDEVYLDHMNTSKSGRPHCTFIVKTKKRSYHLQAASDAAARIWIDAIITGAQGNIDY